MRRLILAMLVVCPSAAFAANFLEFHGSSGKSLTVRVAAVDSILLEDGRLEITTSSQKIRLRVEPLKFEADIGLNSSVAAYRALLLILNGSTKEEDKRKIADWLNLVSDVQRPAVERMKYFTLIFAHSAVIECSEIEVTANNGKG